MPKAKKKKTAEPVAVAATPKLWFGSNEPTPPPELPTAEAPKDKQIGDYLRAINTSKENFMRTGNDPKDITGYPSFFVRQLLSYHQDAILIANEINLTQAHGLDNQLQFEYLLAALPKKNRFAKKIKAEKPENLELIKRYYNYSDEKAMEVIGLLTDADFKQMEASLSEGGRMK